MTNNASGLLPPAIAESADPSLLDPVNVRNTLTIVVADPSLLPNDRVSVTWAGDPNSGADGSHTTPFISFGSTGQLRITLTNALVTFNLANTVTVTYAVMRGSAAPVISRPLVFYVLPLAQRDLPRLLITEAENFGEGPQLDLDGLNSVTLRINAWLLHARGQFLWSRLLGVNADGSIFDKSYWSPPEDVLADQFIRFGFYESILPATDLQSLKQGSVLSLILMAGLRMNPDPSLAQTFAHRNYIVLTDPASAPRIASVVDRDGQDIIDGGDTLSTSVTLRGAAIAEVSVYDGQTLLGTAPSIAGVWEFPVTRLIQGSHIFTAGYAGGGRSIPRTINVLENREVRIKEATGNTNLNPSAVTTALTYVLDYPNLTGDLAIVEWIAAPGTPAAGSYASTLVTVGVTPREIPVPVPLLAFSIGKTVEARASYVRGGLPAVPLQPLALNVQAIASNLLIPPVIDEAKDSGELDKKDIAAGANLACADWIHIAAGQKVSLDLMGFFASGAANNRNIWTPQRNAVHRAWVTNRGYTVRIAPEYFLSLGVGTVLSILFTVRTDQTADSAAVTVFEARRYTITDTR